MSTLTKNITDLGWWLLMSLIIAVSICLQLSIVNHGLTNITSSWLIHAAQRLLAGGKYYYDFLETNPPMSIYVHFPVLALSKILHLNTLISFYIYIYLIAITSLLLTNFLCKKIFPERRNFTYFLITALLAIYTIVPSFVFGEREHIIIMLIMPYIFYNMARVQGIRINALPVVVIALLASIGFIIKPYFLLPLILLELKVIIDTKWKGITLLPEIIISTIYCLYLLHIFIWQQEFLKLILPFNLHFYFLAYSYSMVKWYVFIFYNIMVFIEGTLILYLLWRKGSAYKLYYDFLAVVIIGFAIVNFFNPDWYYHLLPLFTLGWLLATWLLWDFLSTICNFSSINFKLKILIGALFTVVILYAPTYTAIANYIVIKRNTHINIAPQDNILKFFQQHPKARVFGFSFWAYPIYPLVDYTDITAPSRFLSLELLVGILKDIKLHPAFALQQEQIFNQLVFTDLERYSPDIILVDTKMSRYVLGDKNFDFIKYYSKYPWFVRWWQQYHRVKKIGQEEIYMKNPGATN